MEAVILQLSTMNNHPEANNFPNQDQLAPQLRAHRLRLDNLAAANREMELAPNQDNNHQKIQFPSKNGQQVLQNLITDENMLAERLLDSHALSPNCKILVKKRRNLQSLNQSIDLPK